MAEQNSPDGGETPTQNGEGATDQRGGDGIVPSVFDLVGHAIAAAHQSSIATMAQLNVALAAYRLLQSQRDSLGGDDVALLESMLRGVEGSSEALRRITRRDTGGEPGMPRTFGSGMPKEATSDSADTRRE